MTTTPDHSTNPTDRSDDLAVKPQPVTDELRAHVALLHGEGMGRNKIAAEVGVSTATITKIAREAGLNFDRSMTAVAVAAKQIKQAEERAELASMLLVRARESIEAMDSPVVIGQFGGKDNTWNETLLEEPTIADRATLARTASMLLTKHTDLVKHDAVRDLAPAESLIDSLAAGIQASAAAIRASSGLPPIEDERPEDPERNE